MLEFMVSKAVSLGRLSFLSGHEVRFSVRRETVLSRFSVNRPSMSEVHLLDMGVSPITLGFKHD